MDYSHIPVSLRDSWHSLTFNFLATGSQRLHLPEMRWRDQDPSPFKPKLRSLLGTHYNSALIVVRVFQRQCWHWFGFKPLSSSPGTAKAASMRPTFIVFLRGVKCTYCKIRSVNSGASFAGEPHGDQHGTCRFRSFCSSQVVPCSQFLAS